MRNSYSSEQRLINATRGPRRGLVIDSFSQTSATSAWYYRVNVSVYEDVLMPTFIDEDVSDSSSEDRSSDASLLSTTVEHYSILRRYSDFQQLYEHIRGMIIAAEGHASSLPLFPVKELISPAIKGMLRRESSSKAVLEDRSTKFEILLRWIENHPTARYCPAFVKFVGKPPQSHDGYISLKEHTAPDWLSSLQQTTKGMESRRRRYSTGSSNFNVPGSLSSVRHHSEPIVSKPLVSNAPATSYERDIRFSV
ncbi:unnamed protein product [Phytophthora lilii]|uniref:Unnamed protein product n=1 Tax=Phytophthora lilii TaxID=2077276 RepID=A0A9W6WLR0_9STRA|nr:unnamed protein product [Phytophthora lilii]